MIPDNALGDVSANSQRSATEPFRPRYSWSTGKPVPGPQCGHESIKES